MAAAGMKLGRLQSATLCALALWCVQELGTTAEALVIVMVTVALIHKVRSPTVNPISLNPDFAAWGAHGVSQRIPPMSQNHPSTDQKNHPVNFNKTSVTTLHQAGR